MTPARKKQAGETVKPPVAAIRSAAGAAMGGGEVDFSWMKSSGTDATTLPTFMNYAAPVSGSQTYTATALMSGNR